MWISGPQKEAKEPTIPLLRCRAGGKIDATLTGEPLRVFVHYASGRSWPCTNHKCSLCKKGVQRRLYSYYPVRGQNESVGILELTATVDCCLVDQMKMVTDVVSGFVRVTRPSGKRNNPCRIQWLEEVPLTYRGSSSIEQDLLQKALMRIWNLPCRNGEQNEEEYLEKLNEVIRLKTTKTPQKVE